MKQYNADDEIEIDLACHPLMGIGTHFMTSIFYANVPRASRMFGELYAQAPTALKVFGEEFASLPEITDYWSSMFHPYTFYTTAVIVGTFETLYLSHRALMNARKYTPRVKRNLKNMGKELKEEAGMWGAEWRSLRALPSMIRKEIKPAHVYSQQIKDSIARIKEDIEKEQQRWQTEWHSLTALPAMIKNEIKPAHVYSKQIKDNIRSIRQGLNEGKEIWQAEWHSFTSIPAMIREELDPTIEYSKEKYRGMRKASRRKIDNTVEFVGRSFDRGWKVVLEKADRPSELTGKIFDALLLDGYVPKKVRAQYKRTKQATRRAYVNSTENIVNTWNNAAEGLYNGGSRILEKYVDPIINSPDRAVVAITKALYRDTKRKTRNTMFGLYLRSMPAKKRTVPKKEPIRDSMDLENKIETPPTNTPAIALTAEELQQISHIPVYLLTTRRSGYTPHTRI